MEIVIGMTGKPHVTADQHRKIIRTVKGEDWYFETYVADFGEKMAMELLNDTVRIKSGMLFYHGCVGEVKKGTCDEVPFESGEIGKYRIDLLVAKYEKDPVTGLEKFDWDIIKGETSETHPAKTPTLEESDMANGDLIDMVEVARISFNGLNPTLESCLMSEKEIWTDIKKEIALSAHPVGSIYMTTDATNPYKIFGFGTWLLWGAGRVPVGVDGGQEEFKTVEKTGGEKAHLLTKKEMPSHSHAVIYDCTKVKETEGSGGEITVKTVGLSEMNPENGANGNTKEEGGGNAHNNMPPYITCYMWKRTK